MIKSATNLLDQAAQRLRLYFASCRVWPDGTVIKTKEQIARIGGVVIEVYSKEHPPPHFHVRYSGKNASYRIDNCERVEGSLGTKEDKIVKYWFEKEGKDILIDAWNRTRPGDCSVGRYEE
ncbi:MAG: DUF4160 domain-containing protein [Candidatus Aminicenantes bacterium]|nr:DUF4160 domain-containing protein [Candidatus Aminicenantes bacterium]